MCGLAGRFHPRHLAEAPGWGHRAGTLLAHRGPDGAGTFRDRHCELVHRRLALVDLSPNGRQPLANEDGSVQVVFNGEVYNHVALRRMLEGRGHRFRSATDTEVLVHLYEECGPALVDHLRGIFALAIYDAFRQQLLLARDRFGVKPLFHTVWREQVVFASEIKAITAVPGFVPAIDREACYDFLSFGWVPEPATGFRGIAALTPGAVLVADIEGVRVTRRHRVEVRPAPGDLPDVASRVAARLLRATARQGVADVPVAALLSGGLDSSLVVAARQRTTSRGTATFSVRAPDAAHDESALAQSVARHCGTRHTTIDGRDYSLSPDAVLDLLGHFDQPFADTSLFPTYWVATAIRDHGLICALSGDGGDEVFGGYPPFWHLNRLHRWGYAPAWARHAVAGVGRALTPWTRDWGRQLAKGAALASAGRTNPGVLLGGMWAYLTDEDKEALVHPDARAGLPPAHRHFTGEDVPAGATLEDLSRHMTGRLFAVTLPSDMLRKVDMMSMRAGVEVRVPLLDEDVVAVGLALPHAHKTDGRVGKLALRAVAARWLPPEVRRHPKRGFTLPLDDMVPDTLHIVLTDLLRGSDARTRGVLAPRLVEEWLGSLAARGGRRGGVMSRAGLYQRVFMLLALEVWMRAYGFQW